MSQSSVPSYAVVVPTVGRDCLGRLLDALVVQSGPRPAAVVIVDDRTDPTRELVLPAGFAAYAPTTVLRSGGQGPAAARNAGWRAVAHDIEWIAFLDDDVVPARNWAQQLAADLTLDDEVAGSQGRVRVPLPVDRRPTDAERVTAGLASGRWITADMAYRRRVLEHVGGFDERFPRAYREDADIALRVLATGGELRQGTRLVTHPARDVPWWHSVRVQRGNADDPLMRRLHGRGWRSRAAVGTGRRPRHLATVAAAGLAVGAAATGRKRLSSVGALAWAGLTTEFAWARIAPGPRTPDEVARMVTTSVAIPFAATSAWVQGLWRWRTAEAWPLPPAAVLFDRDGTLVHDVPYNGDPERVSLTPHARSAVDKLRARGIAVGLVTNQSGIARGLLQRDQVDAVNARVAQLVGAFDTVQVCPHGEADGCTCRKPAPGMVQAAARELGVPVARVAVIGDIAADIGAAHAAGARGVLVPTAATRPEEVESARRAGLLAPDLAVAVATLLGEG